MKDCKHLKPGDRVVVGGRGAFFIPTIATVDRITATQVIVGNNRFRRDDGHLVGCHFWDSRYISDSPQAFRYAEHTLILHELTKNWRVTAENVAKLRSLADRMEAWLKEAV